jgi:8-amino-7-oxononanoate synthase
VPFEWIRAELDTLSADGLLRRRRVVRPLGNGWCELEGRRLRDFASNDYLGLATDERIVAAAREALADAGSGARASALVAGRGPWHERLERRLAEFEGSEAALLFPTGYAANVGAVTALVGPGDAVFSDRLNHASLIDGCRLSGATVHIYPHCDLESLEQHLSQADAREGTSRRLIVTDSVFSMDGDAAPLRELHELARRYGAMLLIDEAHATGVLGDRGRGLSEHCGIDDGAFIKVGTLSKAIGSQGGFVAGGRDVVDWLFNKARPQMFSTGLAPSACGAALAALDIIEAEPERRRTVLAHAASLRGGLMEAGLATPAHSVGPIVPVVLGDPEVTTRVARRLEDQGFLVAGIRPPTVPQGTSRLRISVSSAHSAEDVAALAKEVIAATM